MEQTGASQVLESIVKPNLQSLTESVSSTTSQIYNEGLNAPVMQSTTEQASQVYNMTAVASGAVYQSVDDMSGGNMSAAVSKTAEAAKSGWANLSSYGSSWYSSMVGGTTNNQ
jgi:hypothetical protein